MLYLSAPIKIYLDLNITRKVKSECDIHTRKKNPTELKYNMYILVS